MTTLRHVEAKRGSEKQAPASTGYTPRQRHFSQWPDHGHVSLQREVASTGRPKCMLYEYLISVIDEGEWSASRSSRFSHCKRFPWHLDCWHHTWAWRDGEETCTIAMSLPEFGFHRPALSKLLVHLFWFIRTKHIFFIQRVNGIKERLKFIDDDSYISAALRQKFLSSVKNI
jgi:hypothetical protein